MLVGRYVSLRIDFRAECLNFGELEVWGPPPPSDALLSLGKPAYASSEAPAGDCPAVRANDGNTANLFHSGFSGSGCNLDGSGPWWGVDLQAKVRGAVVAILYTR